MHLLRFQTFAPQFYLRTCHNLKSQTAELWTINFVSCCNKRSLHKTVGCSCRLSPNKTYALHFFFSLRKSTYDVFLTFPVALQFLPPWIQKNFTAQNLCRGLILCLVVVFNLELWSSEGREPFLGGVASRYFIYTTALHLLYCSFRCGSLGCSKLLWWVTVQKRLKTTNRVHPPPTFLFK